MGILYIQVTYSEQQHQKAIFEISLKTQLHILPLKHNNGAKATPTDTSCNPIKLYEFGVFLESQMKHQKRICCSAASATLL